MYLSRDRFDESARATAYELELDEIGEQLARGQTPNYAPEELARLQRLLAEGAGWKSGDSYKMVGLVGLWLGTPLVLVIAAIWMLSAC